MEELLAPPALALDAGHGRRGRGLVSTHPQERRDSHPRRPAQLGRQQPQTPTRPQLRPRKIISLGEPQERNRDLDARDEQRYSFPRSTCRANCATFVPVKQAAGRVALVVDANSSNLAH